VVITRVGLLSLYKETVLDFFWQHTTALRMFDSIGHRSDCPNLLDILMKTYFALTLSDFWRWIIQSRKYSVSNTVTFGLITGERMAANRFTNKIVEWTGLTITKAVKIMDDW